MCFTRFCNKKERLLSEHSLVKENELPTSKYYNSWEITDRIFLIKKTDDNDQIFETNSL